MTNALLYAAVVIVWGSSWIMIKFQVETVPADASVAYRFVIAALIMFGWAAARGLPLKFRPRDHMFFVLLGALIFSTNYFLFYQAAEILTTGLLAVVFSTASAMTMLINAAISRTRPPARLAIGAALGVGGIAMVFSPELAGLSTNSDAETGLMLCVGGTLSFSFGSLVATRNQKAGLSVRGGTAWGMAYGTILLFAYVLLRGAEFGFDTGFAYTGSLIYLAVFSTVVAFACYFALLARIGPERSAYATVLFPIVALGLSTVFEGYQWTAIALVGVALTLVGNVLVLAKPRSASQAAPRDASA